MAELVRVIYIHIIPDLGSTQGPFSISVTFLLLAYFETFVVWVVHSWPARQNDILGWDFCRARGVSRLPHEKVVAAALDFPDCSCRRTGIDDHPSITSLLCGIDGSHARVVGCSSPLMPSAN